MWASFMLTVLILGVLSEQPACTQRQRACSSSILRFAQSKPAGFVVGTNLALKRLTYFLPDVHAALRASTAELKAARCSMPCACQY